MTRIWICGAALDSIETSLPDDCQTPVVMKMDVNAMPSIMYSLSTTDGSDVVSLANEDIVPELEAIGSVASVEVSGGRENYVQVLLDEDAMNQYGLTMSSIAQYIATTDFTIPIGSLEQGSQSISAISSADVENVEDLKNIPLFISTAVWCICLMWQRCSGRKRIPTVSAGTTEKRH